MGTVLDAAFGGEDVPTRVSDPEIGTRSAPAVERVRVERVRGARPPVRTPRPIPPWVPLAQRSDAPELDAPTMDAPEPRRESGFGRGLVLGFGLAGFLFGILAVAVAGIVVVVRGLPQRTATPRAPAPIVAEATPIATPAILAKAEPIATPVVVTKATPIAGAPTPIVVAKAAPAPAPVVVAKPVASPARTTRVAAVAPRPLAVPVVEAPAATPTPTPASAQAPSKPSHDELLSLATSARRAATPAAPVATVAVAAATSAPDPFAAPTATPAPFVPTEEPVAGGAAAPATNDAELADILGAPSVTPAAAPAPKPKPVAKKLSSHDTGERVIHARSGDKPVFLNANIALTRADGKTLVGKLLAVVDGFVDVKTSDARLRIAESDVLDAATY